ncbi:MAG TPA: UTP--glucose-1-phosphate uridylyltransferase GalU [Acidimicrobiales bacterium]|jgi:UTP--glucose-1-phosphate uridylyltransferase|nr:UTP--glucose-1-phosphate uridylyltransferase GalU [Acidimicrobiales bacterium]
MDATHGAVRKAVVPAAGLGTRFLPATKAQPKEMLPIVDKPAIQYVVEEAVQAGLTDILVVTGRNKRSIEDHFDRQGELEFALDRAGKHDMLAEVQGLADLADIHYVRQGEPLGLGHAVGVAAKHVGDQPFAVLLGDDIMVDEARLLRRMIEVYEARGGTVLALKQVPIESISSYGCAAVETTDEPDIVRLTGIEEKPKPADAPSNYAVMGRYIFSPRIFDAIDKIEPGVGGEIQLTDAISFLMDTEPVYGVCFTDGRYDVGDKLDYLRATVELALERDDLGAEFATFLADLVRDRGL